MLFLKNKCGHDVKKNICGTLISPLIEDRNHPGITSYRLRGKKGFTTMHKIHKSKVYVSSILFLKKMPCERGKINILIVKVL